MALAMVLLMNKWRAKKISNNVWLPLEIFHAMHLAPTMQVALDNWDSVVSQLEKSYTPLVKQRACDRQ
ncbi:hypothetical protein O9992_23010 [Vibrio lentus]|nr:hypothetical protein [Vibrio lentus]